MAIAILLFISNHITCEVSAIYILHSSTSLMDLVRPWAMWYDLPTNPPLVISTKLPLSSLAMQDSGKPGAFGKTVVGWG